MLGLRLLWTEDGPWASDKVTNVYYRKMKSIFYTACSFAIASLSFAGCVRTKSEANDALTMVSGNSEKRIGRTRTYYRGENEILSEHVLSDGRRALFYSQNGRRILSETDEDGDGFMETLILFPDDLVHAEVFRRGTNGCVTPLDSAELRQFRGNIQKAVEAFRNAQQP